MLTKTGYEAVMQSEITQMPAFNTTIQVEVSVDAMFQKLLDLLPVDYKHREVLAHAIIGSAVEKGNITYVYAALNGYTNDIDFEKDQEVVCSTREAYEWYDNNKEDKEGNLKVLDQDPTSSDYKPDWKSRRREIGKCTIKEINLYADNKLTVEYETEDQYDRGRGKKKLTTVVNHKNCTRVPMYPEPVEMRK
jgi:hypothetical protein